MSEQDENEPEQYLLITAVHEDGLHVVLSDGSSWDVPPGPSTRAVLWYPTQRVTLEKDERSGALTLTNLDTSGPDKVPVAPGSWDPDDEEDE